MNMLKDKRGVEGATLTWIVATFIILMIMVLYIVFSGIVFTDKGSLDINDLSTKYSNDFISTKTIINVMNLEGFDDANKVFINKEIFINVFNKDGKRRIILGTNKGESIDYTIAG